MTAVLTAVLHFQLLILTHDCLRQMHHCSLRKTERKYSYGVSNSAKSQLSPLLFPYSLEQLFFLIFKVQYLNSPLKNLRNLYYLSLKLHLVAILCPFHFHTLNHKANYFNYPTVYYSQSNLQAQ